MERSSVVCLQNGEVNSRCANWKDTGCMVSLVRLSVPVEGTNLNVIELGDAGCFGTSWTLESAMMSANGAVRVIPTAGTIS